MRMIKRLAPGFILLFTMGPGFAQSPQPLLLPDAGISSVSPSDIFFDTFDGRYIPLSKMRSEDILRLRDRIRPIYRPKFVSATGADWLYPNDRVIIHRGETVAYAYPLKILDYHEIVNHSVDGLPVLVTYCPLCSSGVVFERRLDGETTYFGNTSALYQNNMVMYDYATLSYWVQVSGEAITGKLTGRKLEVLPSMTMTWKEWLQQDEPTRVLSLDQGLATRYPYQRQGARERESVAHTSELPLPLVRSRHTARVPATSMVLSVRAGEFEKVFPLRKLQGLPVNDVVGGEPVVIFSQKRGLFGFAYSAEVDGRRLTFLREEKTIIDEETRSTWKLTGKAVNGPMTGKQLRPLPTRLAQWFSIARTLPDIEVYGP